MAKPRATSREKPLAGKRIIVTRAADQSHELVSALESKGATVIIFPLVAFAPPDDWSILDQQLKKLDGFDAILFLSRNAVRYVFQRCRELGIKCEFSPMKRPFVATVGPATQQALNEEGWSVDYVAKDHTAESLVQEIGDRLAGKSVFLPRGNRGDDDLPGALRRAGATVTEVVAYQTCAPSDVSPSMLDHIHAGNVDSVVFASPSAFHNLCSLISRSEIIAISERVQFAAIGPTTARAIREFGAHVAVEAADPSAAGMADALASSAESKGLRTRRV
ncbi:MAG: uroporphyrinogen-III synthase [Candidatus Acidiferrales bacterium]